MRLSVKTDDTLSVVPLRDRPTDRPNVAAGTGATTLAPTFFLYRPLPASASFMVQVAYHSATHTYRGHPPSDGTVKGRRLVYREFDRVHLATYLI